MATSKQGQHAVICQLCEETFEVKWKCLTCQFFMCTRCCKIHEKFKSSVRHDIVNIKDGSAIQEVKKDFSNIKCGFHNGQRCYLFCQKCEELVCLTCVAKTHNTHAMLEFSEGSNFMLNKLKERKTKLINENENKASHLKSFRETEHSIYEKERKKIIDHGKVLKETVDKQIGKLLDDLDGHWNEKDQSLRQEEKRLEVEQQEKKKKIEMLTSTIGSQNPDDVIKNYRSEKELTTEKTRFPKFLKLPRFEAERVATSAKIISACGILKQSGPEVMSKTKLNFEIEREIQLPPNTGNIFNVLVNDDESVWINMINDVCSKELIQLDLSETCQVGNIQNSFNIKVFDMAKTKDGDLLLSTQKPELRMIPKTTGQIKKSHIRVDEGLYTVAIHVTHDNKIIMGVNSYANNLPSYHGDRSFVQKMNAFGKIESVYELDKAHNKLFTFPVRIASDKNNNINIMDRLNPRQDGRIVLLSPSGEIRGIYSGHPMINKKCPLKPCTMASTKFGSIIVSDWENHMLHILNTKGQCIQYQDTRRLGFAFPYAMDIDGDVLQICAKSAGKYTKDKIVAVKLS